MSIFNKKYVSYIPKWTTLKKTLSTKANRISPILVFLLFSINNISYSYKEDTSFFSHFLAFIDFEAFILPTNAQRLMLASALLTIANALYSLFCPEIIRLYKNYDEWRESDPNYIEKRNSELKAKGNRFGAEFEENSKKSFTTELGRKNNSRLLARVAILLTTLLAGYIASLIFIGAFYKLITSISLEVLYEL